MVTKESDLMINLAEKQLRRLNDSLQSLQNKIDLEDSILYHDTNLYSMPMINTSSLPEFDNMFVSQASYSPYHSLNQTSKSHFKDTNSRNNKGYPQRMSSYGNLNSQKHQKYSSKYAKGSLQNLSNTNSSSKSSKKPTTSSSLNYTNRPKTKQISDKNLIRDWRHGYKLAQENLGPMPSGYSRHYNDENMSNNQSNKSPKQKLSTFWDYDVNRKSERHQSSKPRENEYTQGIRPIETRGYTKQSRSPSKNSVDKGRRSTTRTKSEIRRYIRERDKIRRQKQKEQQKIQESSGHRSRNNHGQQRSYESTGKYLSKGVSDNRKSKGLESDYRVSPKNYVKNPTLDEYKSPSHISYSDTYSHPRNIRNPRTQSHSNAPFIKSSKDQIETVPHNTFLNTTMDSGIGTGEFTMNATSKKNRFPNHTMPHQDHDQENHEKSNPQLQELRVLAKQADSGSAHKNKYYDLLEKMYRDQITAYDNETSDTDQLDRYKPLSDDDADEYEESAGPKPDDIFEDMIDSVSEDESLKDLIRDDMCSKNSPYKSNTSRGDQYNQMSTQSNDLENNQIDVDDDGDDADDDDDDDSSSLAKELRHALLEAHHQLNLPIERGKSLNKLSKKIYKAVQQFLETKSPLRTSIQTQVSQSLDELNQIESFQNQPIHNQQKNQIHQQFTASDKEEIRVFECFNNDQKLSTKMNTMPETPQTNATPMTEAYHSIRPTDPEIHGNDVRSDISDGESKIEEIDEEEVMDAKDHQQQFLEKPRECDSIMSINDELLMEPRDVCKQKHEELLKYYEINMENLQTNTRHMSSRRDRANLLITLTKQYKSESDKVKRLEKKAFNMSRKLLPSQTKNSSATQSSANQNYVLSTSPSQVAHLPPRHSVPPDGLECEYSLSLNMDKVPAIDPVTTSTPHFDNMKSSQQPTNFIIDTNIPNANNFPQQHELQQPHNHLIGAPSESDEHTLTIMSELTSTLSDQSDLDAQIIALKSELNKKKNLVSNLKRKRKELKRERIQSKERALEKQIEICDDQVKILQDNITDLEHYNAADMTSMLSSNSSHKPKPKIMNHLQNNLIKAEEDSQNTDDNDDTLKEDIVSEQVSAKDQNPNNYSSEVKDIKINSDQSEIDKTESEEIISNKNIVIYNNYESNYNQKYEPISSEKLETHEKCEISGLNGDHDKSKGVIETSDVDAQSITEEITIEKHLESDIRNDELNSEEIVKDNNQMQHSGERRNTLDDLELINLDSDEGINNQQKDLDNKQPFDREKHPLPHFNGDDATVESEKEDGEVEDELEEDSLETSMRRNRHIIINDDDFADGNEMADDGREEVVMEEEILPEPPKRKHRQALKLPEAHPEDERNQEQTKDVTHLINDIVDKLLDAEVKFFLENIVQATHTEAQQEPCQTITDERSETSEDEQVDNRPVTPPSSASSVLSQGIDQVSLDNRIKWFMPIKRDAVSPVIDEAIDLLYEPIRNLMGPGGMVNTDDLAKSLHEAVNMQEITINKADDSEATFKQQDLLLARAQLLGGPFTLDAMKVKNNLPSSVLESSIVDKRAIFLLIKEIFLNIFSPHRLKAASSLASHPEQPNITKPWIHPSATIRCQNYSLWKANTPPESKELVTKIVYFELETLLSRFYESQSTSTLNLNSHLQQSLLLPTNQNRMSSLESKSGTKQFSRMIQWCLSKQKDDIDRLLVQEMRIEDSDWVFYDEAEELVKVQVADDMLAMVMDDTVEWLRTMERDQSISIQL